MTAQIKICICFSLVTHFPSIWVTNKSRICLCNIQRKHLSCPSQVYTNNLLFQICLTLGVASPSLYRTETLADTPRSSSNFSNQFLIFFLVFLLHDSVFVLTCFNPLGVIFLKKCWILNQDFVSLWLDRVKDRDHCKLEKCWAWPKVMGV